MWNLQTISTILLNKQSTSLIKKGTFPNIKRMGLRVEENGYEGELPNVLQHLQQLKHLNKLVIFFGVWSDRTGKEQIQSLGQFNCLTFLMINNVSKLLTSELIFPPNITELMLTGIRCITDEGINGLGNHFKLKILSLWGSMGQIEDSVDLNCADGSFPQLEVLQMRFIRLRKWELGNGAMQKLQHVLIHRCQPLDNLPTQLCSLNGLKKVHITDSVSKQMTHILGILETNNGVQIDRGDHLSRVENDGDTFDII
ncbi:uncharacterized protein HKW66_Vig0135600 [Vigna angularis]|uniref:NB-ARC domain-containing protein n=2 Tax=Phaseolus angularis TaxID=3914 RepID=A0A8T0KF07_PHAAN|nr:uncharacterized protein HKW66_Vig0135600 [Vigna angularis]